MLFSRALVVPPRTVLLLCVSTVLSVVPLSGQGIEPRPLGARITADVFSDLPTGTTVYSLLDTVVAEAINDRVDAGTLGAGEAARTGARGSSWTQTTFRLGEVDITDPTGSGAPMLIPGLLPWQRVDVATAAMGMDLNAPGMAVTLVPRRPTTAWTRTIEVSGMPGHGGFDAQRQPPISRQTGWKSGSFFASGPLVADRVGLVAAANWTRTRRVERELPVEIGSGLSSLYANLVFTPSGRDEISIIGWGDRTHAPFEDRLAFRQPHAEESGSAFHTQASWSRSQTSGVPWTGFVSFSRRARETDLAAPGDVIVERLDVGPIPELVQPVPTSRTWSIGLRAAPKRQWRGRPHVLETGVTFSAANAHGRSPFEGRIGELVDGAPARVWTYKRPEAHSRWSRQDVSLYVGDRFSPLARVTLNAGLRFEAVGGSASGSTAGVSWYNWFPRAGIRWELTERARIAAIVKYSRSGYQLSLRDLAFGDPAAPVGDVFRWTTSSSAPRIADLGPPFERVGPGTGGTAGFTGIDRNLERPYSEEMILGWEARPSDNAVARLVTIARRDRRLLGVINTGVPPSAYRESTIVDPGTDHAGGRVLFVYDHPANTYGQDRYVVTNPSGNDATFVGVEISAEVTRDRFFWMMGGTAGRVQGQGANRGFNPLENDLGLLGELFTNPNATTNAVGRTLTERGYTAKMVGVYRAPRDVRLGVIARYEDGQHFARLVMVPGLNQGVEAIRAFSNGRTRFMFQGTLDVRLQKMFRKGAAQFALVLDGYNVVNMQNEIEEFTPTGPLSRLVSAVQPPRTVHIGARVTF
jgi:hypothetical protein